jgi:peptide/nickel transport system substrate-binding protein
LSGRRPQYDSSRSRLGGVLVSIVVILGVCSSLMLGGSASASTISAVTKAVPAATPQSGGTLSVAINEDPAGCVDPPQSGLLVARTVERGIVDSLTYQDPKTGQIVPWLAKSWDVNSNSTEFTFHLRSGVTFSNGQPLTAAAVKTSFEGVVTLGAKAPVAGTYLGGLTSVEVLAPLTVRFVFSQPNAQFLQATTTELLGIEAPATFQYTPAQRCADHVIGSGPFVYQSYTPNQQVVEVKRQGYNWPPSGAAHGGDAYLNEVTFPIIPENNVQTGSLQSGQVDAITPVPAQNQAQFTGNGFGIVAVQNPGIVIQLTPNLSGPILSDLPVRQAIQHLINRQQIVSTVESSLYEPTTSVLSSSTPGYVNLSADLEYNLPEAESLLSQAGWKVGAGGIRTKNGQQLSLTVNSSGTTDPALLLVQQELRQGGINLVINSVTEAQVTADQTDHDYDLAYGNFTRADPDILEAFFLAGPGAILNLNDRKPGPLDTLFAAQQATTNPAKRDAIEAQLQRDIITQGYSFPVYQYVTSAAYISKVHDLQFTRSAQLFLYDAWVS